MFPIKDLRAGGSLDLCRDRQGSLGRIQGAAQMLTVVSSAVGPLLLAVCQERYQSYGPMFYALALLCGLCAVGVWAVPLPRGNNVGART